MRWDVANGKVMVGNEIGVKGHWETSSVLWNGSDRIEIWHTQKNFGIRQKYSCVLKVVEHNNLSSIQSHAKTLAKLFVLPYGYRWIKVQVRWNCYTNTILSQTYRFFDLEYMKNDANYENKMFTNRTRRHYQLIQQIQQQLCWISGAEYLILYK